MTPASHGRTTQLPFPAEQLNKAEIYAYQASKRGGYLHCRMEGNNRIIISGEAALAAVSEIVAEL